MATDAVTESSIKVRVPGSTPGVVGSVQCGDCGAVFSRSEHLTRHRRSHTNERPFACSDCGKRFSRVDVLTRHTASHHETPPSPGRDGILLRACRECATSRVRCSRGEPCNRCSRKGLQCVYPTARKRRASEEGAGRRAARRTEELTIVVGNDINGTPQSQPAVPNSAPGAFAIAVEPTPEQLPWMPLRSDPPVNGSFMADGLQGPPETYGFGEPVPMPDAAMSAMNWLSPGDSMQFDWSSQLATGAGGFETLGFPFLADLDLPAEQVAWPATPSIPDQHNTRSAEPLAPSTYGAGQSPLSTTSLRNSGSEEAAKSATSSSSVGMFYVDGNPWRAPLKASPSRRRSSRTVLGNDGIPSASSPDETTAMRDDPRVDAPPARVYANVLTRIKAEAPLWDGQSLDLTEYPSPSQMQAFFGLYFQCFHHTLPFLRRDASFYELPCHWVLLLALCAIGSRYGPGGLARSSSLLFDTLGKVLSRRAGGFPFDTPLLPWEAPRVAAPDDEDPLSLVQAAMLNLIWKVHGGRGHAEGGALAERHRVVAACHNMDLLGEVESERRAASGPRDWWEEQSRIRTGLTIWLLDSILEYEIGSQPLLKLGDIKGPLPCRERLWEDPHAATTPHESSQTTTVHDAIETIYVEKKLPPSLSDFGVTLLTHAVCRRATEAVSHHETPLASWVPTATTQSRTPSRPASQTWPPALPVLSRWRNSACDGLDVLHLNANSIIAKGWGWEPPAVLHLHLSRMLLLTPVAPLQVLAAAASLPRQRVRAVDAAAARGKVLRWAIDDQYKARLAIIHAGSLFWHVRRHSADSFLEPFGVFLATLVMWAYSTSAQFASRSLSGAQGQREGTPKSASAGGGVEGEEEEDAEPPFVHLDRPIDDEAVQAYVRLGPRMSGYLSRVGDICKEGAPRRILREGREVLLRRRDRGASEGGESECGERGFVWGVAGSYVEALGCLIQSSGE